MTLGDRSLRASPISHGLKGRGLHSGGAETPASIGILTTRAVSQTDLIPEGLRASETR